MKLYRIRVSSTDRGTLVGWAANQHAARIKAGELLADACDGRVFDRSTDSIDAIDVPTHKLGLLSWLNTYFDTDNG